MPFFRPIEYSILLKNSTSNIRGNNPYENIFFAIQATPQYLKITFALVFIVTIDVPNICDTSYSKIYKK